MTGRNSVAIAIDARFGLGMQTISISSSAGSPLNNRHDDEDGEGEDEVLSSAGATTGNPRIIHLPNSNALLAWTGLYGDGLGFAEEMNVLLGRKVRRAGCMGFQYSSSSSSSNSGGLRRNRRKKMSPRAITSLMSHLLYRRRNAPYYVEPILVGLESVRVPVISDIEDKHHEVALALEKGIGESTGGLQAMIEATTTSSQQLIPQAIQQGESKQSIAYKTFQKPYICGTDMLGAQSSSQSFVCSGVASRSLHGTAEALWRPNLEAEELVEVCGRAFVSALERDCLSGYGAVVYLIQSGDGGGEDDVQIIEYVLACRND